MICVAAWLACAVAAAWRRLVVCAVYEEFTCSHQDWETLFSVAIVNFLWFIIFNVVYLYTYI